MTARALATDTPLNRKGPSMITARRILIVFKFMLILSALSPVFSQDRVPQFKDYPAAAYSGPNAALVLTRDDRNFRTRLREASKERPNFAGHYILTAWGCGTSCLMGAVIDAKSGRVHWWNFTICCWTSTDDNFKPIEFRLNSKLVVFSGARNEKEGDEAAHFYKFENGRFVHLRSFRSVR